MLDQHPSKIAFSALGNTYCSISLNVRHQNDVSAVTQSMLLGGEEKDILGSHEVGQAVVKLQGRVPRPFLIRLPEFDIRKGALSDADLREKMIASGVIQETATAPAPLTDFGLSVTGPPPTNPKTLEFLADVAAHPHGGIAARYVRLATSARQGQRLKNDLVTRGLLSEREERADFGRFRVLELTDKGAEMLRATGGETA